MIGKLFVVGTPIGNLGDMSPRAIETLRNCDFIAAEDTRVTIKLLNHFSIKKPMISYFEHNKRERGNIICKRIENGETCVLVSDAGMPAISDPGEELVKQCYELGLEVTVIPGPSALIAALAISGLAAGRFTFEGFLSVNKKSRIEHLQEIRNETRTLIFYEAPHKFLNTLKDMYEYLGDRNISIVREITKIHEEVIRTTISNAICKYSEDKIKGEIVLIVEGKPKLELCEKDFIIDDVVKLCKPMLEQGIAISEIAKKISKTTGIKKGQVYKKLLEIK